MKCKYEAKRMKTIRSVKQTAFLIVFILIHELELENDHGAVETSFLFFIARF